MRPRVAVMRNMPLHRPQGVAIVGIYPCGKAWNSPPPWTAPGRSEGRRCSRGERGWMGRIVGRANVHNAKQVTGQHEHFGGLG